MARMNQRDAGSAVSTADQPPSAKEIVIRREVMAPWQARCIKAYIAVNLHSTIRVMDLVRVVQFAPNRFDRVFKKTFDCSPHQYVMRMRIAQAQRLLLRSDDPLSKIAAACGFGNQSHLSNLFRKMMGQPPGQWRRVHSAGTSRLQFSDIQMYPEPRTPLKLMNKGEYDEKTIAVDVEML